MRRLRCRGDPCACAGHGGAQDAQRVRVGVRERQRPQHPVRRRQTESWQIAGDRGPQRGTLAGHRGPGGARGAGRVEQPGRFVQAEIVGRRGVGAGCEILEPSGVRRRHRAPAPSALPPVTTSRIDRPAVSRAILGRFRRSVTSTAGSQSASRSASSESVPRELSGTPIAAARTVARRPSTNSTLLSRQKATLAPRRTPSPIANRAVRRSSSAQLTARRSSVNAGFSPCRKEFSTSNSATGRTSNTPATPTSCPPRSHASATSAP